MEGLSNSVSTVIQLWKAVNLRIAEVGETTFSETSVRNNAAQYKFPDDIFNRLSVFDRRVLRRIFRSKRDELTRGWRKLHDLYSTISIIRIIKLRRMRWAEHIARMGKIRKCIGY
jgi:hypothetical protein